MEKPSLSIPTIETIDGKSSVKFVDKTYPEFIKDNTQTNLRSVDLGDGNYSYTVQRNIIFDTPKVEKAKQQESPKVVNVSATKPTSDIESKRADIERRRQEDLNDVGVIDSSNVNGFTSLLYGIKRRSESKNYLGYIGHPGVQIREWSEQEVIDAINAKYDLELATLKKPKVEVIQAKPQQQRRGNGKSIERKKPLSDEDLMPNFSEAIEESIGFEVKKKSTNLQTDFITYAKSQSPEIKRSLIAMNRNKEIEVKCK